MRGDCAEPNPLIYHSSHHKTDSDVENVKSKNRKSLIDALVRNRPELEKNFLAFEAKRKRDSGELESAAPLSPMMMSGQWVEGYVTPEEWGEILRSTLGLAIGWVNLQPMLAPTEKDGTYEGRISWKHFLDSYKVKKEGKDKGKGKSTSHDANKMAMLYENHKTLLMMFDYFDTDRDGKVSEADWNKGCEWVNEQLGPGEKLDSEGLFSLLDFYDQGEIDRNEFYEGFRISTRSMMAHSAPDPDPDPKHNPNWISKDTRRCHRIQQ